MSFGLGYRAFLEPYLRHCGFEVVTLVIPCAAFDPRVRDVWRRWAGFSEFFQLTYRPGGDEPYIEYLAFKEVSPSLVAPASLRSAA